ncbi:MAG TPA: hypothetical protein DCK93_17100, partial [Blastocatellia bacterium]|nr:hypothetical protein [Blastocatellia bacterium]
MGLAILTDPSGRVTCGWAAIRAERLGLSGKFSLMNLRLRLELLDYGGTASLDLLIESGKAKPFR